MACPLRDGFIGQPTWGKLMMMMIARATLLLTLSLALLGAPDSAALAGPKPLVISTMPFDDPAAQAAVFNLLSKHLAQALGRPVEFEAGRSYSEVIARLKSGKIDIAFVGAASYIEARRSGNVRAILRTIRHRNSSYHGIVVVKQGSPIKELTDLKGKRFAFVDRSSTAGYFYPRRLLARAGLDPNQDVVPLFAGGHHKVVQMVAEGKADAGACYEGAQETLQNPQEVVPIARTEPILGDPVVVRPGLGRELISQLRSALIELALVPEARNFFVFSEIDGFVPASDREYDRLAKQIHEAGG